MGKLANEEMKTQRKCSGFANVRISEPPLIPLEGEVSEGRRGFPRLERWGRVAVLVLSLLGTGVQAQTVLTLDSCRAMAMRSNKQLAVSKAGQEKAYWEHKAAVTNFLPKIDFSGGYLFTSKEVSLLSNDQKNAFNNLGTNMLQQGIQGILERHPDLAPLIEQMPADVKGLLNGAAESINGVGRSVTDAFRTDTRNAFAGAVLLTQPLYMGGKIRAYYKITGYQEQLEAAKQQGVASELILEVDKAYWQIVSLSGKYKLAKQYRDMLRKLDEDVQKMVAEGVATKANELTVSVKLNEAEMTLAKVEDGLSLSRMLLCQLCGLPLGTAPALDAELADDIPVDQTDVTVMPEKAMANRAEIKQLQLAADIYSQKVKIERSAFLPSLALIGGYGFSNPSLVNGFEKRFRGMWSVGLLLKIPVFHWGEGMFKVNAAKAEAMEYRYKLEEAKEKIELQVNQQTNCVNDAVRKYRLSLRNLEKAEENLRTAQIGYKEGIITTSDLLAAQTAWLSAQNDKTDAQVNINISRATLNNVLGY